MLCPNCGSEQVIKKGMRKTKHNSYPAKVIVHAFNTYNKGYTLDKTARLVNT
jgi:transposase-like protein